MKAQSFFGSVELLDKVIIITRKGAGSKTIPLSSITGVEYKKGGLLSGYIRFSFAGAEGTKRRVHNKNQELLQDPNAVLFNFTKNNEFGKLADTINRLLFK